MVFGALVVFITTYALILPAITMETPTYCGSEEHVHSSACFSPVLICGNQDAPGMALLSGPETVSELVCGMEEHIHDEACFDSEGNLTCDREEHRHNDSCYQTVEAEPAHVHTAACYEYVLTCQEPEHRHSLQCYSNPEADTDSTAWENAANKAIEKLGQDQTDTRKRVVAAAGALAGYTESQQNYWVADDGVTKYGYTMFGAAYGAPYAQWNALYVDWVLQKAAVPGFPLAVNADAWVRTLTDSDKNGTQFVKRTDPQVGDLVFVRTEGAPEETEFADLVGIIYGANENGIYVYQGDHSDKVAVAYYALDDARIVCYVSLPVDPVIPEEPAAAPVAAQSTEIEIPQTAEEPVQTEDAAVEFPSAVSKVEEYAKEKDATRVFFTDDTEKVSFEDQAEEPEEPEEPEETVQPEKVVTADPEMIAAMQEAEERLSHTSIIEKVAGFFSGLFKAGYDSVITVPVGDVTVVAAYNQGVLPDNVAMAVTPVSAEPYTGLIAEATGRDNAQLLTYDITFLSGNEIVEPDGEVKIAFQADFIETAAQPEIVHIEAGGNAEVIETAVTAGEISGVTESFSVYALSYTVDFHGVIDGKEYTYSIKGGSGVSVTGLLPAVGLVADDPETEENEVRTFVEGIASITFSRPELLWVAKVETDTTIGDIKDENALVTAYTAELTKEQILELDGKTVEAGDWVLISLQPFQTEELLTITMQEGQIYEIRVTDEQISTNVLTASGQTYKITVTYEAEAEIPAGTTLSVHEIDPESDAYREHLGQTWSQVNQEYLAQEERLRNQTGELDDLVEERKIHPVNLDDVRFFDISLISNGKEIEPKAPVCVDIQYVDGLQTPEEKPPVIGVVHFAEAQVEQIEEVQTTQNANGEVVRFTYMQDSFSDIGTFAGQETEDPGPSLHLASPAVPRLAAAGDGEGSETPMKDELGEPTASKNLRENNDGTYTLSLSVTGASKKSEQQSKANILFIMDRSSSMQNNYVHKPYTGEHQNGTTYYGLVGDDYRALNYSNGRYYYNNNEYTGTVYTRTTRLVEEQGAMSVLFTNLMELNMDDGGNYTKDNVEISVISFADDRGKMNEGTEYPSGGATNGWTYSDYTGLMTVVNNNNTPSGTNWEDALQYAKEVADAKKAQQPDEPVFVIFLTDGEPTAVAGESGGAKHYISNGNTVGGGFIAAYIPSRDDAKAIVDAGYPFYGIFTFNPGEEQTRYLKRLVHYAYTGYDGSDTTTGDFSYLNTSQYVDQYFSNADNPQSLVDTFDAILSAVTNVIGHGNVKIIDGLTTDAMTSTLVAGRTDGFTYSVKDEHGTTLYTVTANGPTSAPNVTFHIGGDTYSGSQVTEKTDASGHKYYSVMAGGKEYKMALAGFENIGTGPEQVKKLTWDLSAIGILEDKCTYTIETVVWPNQEAYDYVSALNNGLMDWNESTQVPVYDTDGTTVKYYKKGVEGYPSIVLDPRTGIYSVLTNTEQELEYSIISKVNGVETVEGPYNLPLETPEPMPLTASESSLEKVWNVERDLLALAHLLYDENGNATEFYIDYAIMKKSIVDENEANGTEADEENTAQVYKTLRLGWDENLGKYVWDSDSVRYTTYNGHRVQVGTRWTKDFAIATGLMLSEARMDELGLDKSAYSSYLYGSTRYYVLEPGYDYTIEEIVPENEETWVTFEFDFISPTYHPMLVNGELKNVEFTETNNEITGISSISNDEWLNSLMIENTLRGYINLEKRVVDKDGKTPLPEDDQKFEYNAVLENYSLRSEENPNAGPFTEDGSHVPWYGINGLYYHVENDEEHRYYQATPNGVGSVIIKDEEGNIFNATCTGEFKEIVGPQDVTFTVDGEPVTLALTGNQMVHVSDQYVTATLWMSQDEVLSIANVPVKTKYTITEAAAAGYDLVSIQKEIRNGNVIESSSTSTGSATIVGTIVADRDNHFIYTNKVHSVDITLEKVDENNIPLTGATFTLTKAQEGEEPSDTVYTRPAPEETDTGTYQFADLPDGSYTLHETPPPGYEQIDDMTFDVVDGQVVNLTVPQGITRVGDTLTFRVVNTPQDNPGQITVRKQWQDYFGNPSEPGAENVTVTLKRRVDVPQEKTLRVVVQVRNWQDNGYNVRINDTWTITHDSAIVSWYDNNQYNYEHGRMSINTSNGLSYETQSSGGGGNPVAVFKVSGLQNATGTPTITFSYTRSNEYWIYNQINSYAIEGSGNELHFEGDSQDDPAWTDRVITLNSSNNWSETISSLPTSDSSGNAYHYYIAEQSIPGYTVSYSSNNENGVISGVLTAYNKKNTVDVLLEKVDQFSRSVRLNGATFELRQLDPESTGSMGTRTLTGGRLETLTTSGEGSQKGTLTISDLGIGCYEIKETVAPAGYILEGDPTFYIRITETAIQLLQKDESKAAEEWAVLTNGDQVTIQNATLTVVNTPGEELPSTGGVGTRLFYLIGSLLVLGAIVILVTRRITRK